MARRSDSRVRPRPPAAAVAMAALVVAGLLAGCDAPPRPPEASSAAPSAAAQLPLPAEVPAGWSLVPAASLPAFLAEYGVVANPGELRADRLQEVAGNLYAQDAAPLAGRIAVYERPGFPNETLSFVALHYAADQDVTAWQQGPRATGGCGQQPWTGIVVGPDALLVLGRRDSPNRPPSDAVFLGAVAAQRNLQQRPGVAAVCGEDRLRSIELMHARPDVTEPNDDADHAAPLNPGYGGLVLGVGDEDWFRFNVTQDDLPAVAWASGDGQALAMELYDAHGAKVADGRRQPQGTALCTGVTAGAWFVRVTSVTNESVSRYNVFVEHGAEAYQGYCG